MIVFILILLFTSGAAEFTSLPLYLQGPAVTDFSSELVAPNFVSATASGIQSDNDIAAAFSGIIAATSSAPPIVYCVKPL